MHLYYGGIHVNSTIYFERQLGFRNNQNLAYIVSSNATFDFINRLPEIKGPGYVTVCEVNALGDFENCKHAVTGLPALFRSLRTLHLYRSQQPILLQLARFSKAMGHSMIARTMQRNLQTRLLWR